MTSADRELLALAAKAYGIEIDGWTKCNLGVEVAIYLIDGQEFYWQPLLNNALTDCMGDALRLALVCNLILDCVDCNAARSARSVGCNDWYGGIKDDPGCGGGFDDDRHKPEFMRRAIVRAAAEVGKGMLTQDEFMKMFPGRFDDAEIGKTL